MTWSRAGKAVVTATAYSYTDADGSKNVRLGVGTQYIDLSETDAASLGGYLMGTTNNEKEVSQ